MIGLAPTGSDNAAAIDPHASALRPDDGLERHARVFARRLGYAMMGGDLAAPRAEKESP